MNPENKLLQERFNQADQTVNVNAKAVIERIKLKRKQRKKLIGKLVTTASVGLLLFASLSFNSSGVKRSSQFSNEDLEVANQDVDLEWSNHDLLFQDQPVDLNQRLTELKSEIRSLEFERANQIKSLVGEKISREHIELPKVNLVNF